MASKTHWKKLTNPDYLGAYALEDGEDMIVTIKNVSTKNSDTMINIINVVKCFITLSLFLQKCKNPSANKNAYTGKAILPIHLIIIGLPTREKPT